MQSETQVNILLADDEPENLIALEAVLEGLGQNLVKANSGEDVLRYLLYQDFAVILLDVQMPKLDGFETAMMIRQRERSHHTPIIFLTAFSTSDSLMCKGYSLGAVDYLFKPIDPVILSSKVSVFVDLYKKTLEVQRQGLELAAINAELRQSEERFRTLSACSPVGIFLTDIEGHCTYANPRCQEICGFNLQDNSNQGWLDFVHPEDQERAIANWLTHLRDGHEYSDEFRLQRQDSTCWVHLRSSPMLSNVDTLVGHVGTLEDITERKQAETARAQIIQEQVARREAETANRLKDEFLAVLSHELRTPLNAILGWSRLLLTKDFDAEKTLRALETIERNAKSQAELVEDILDVSLIIQGKLRLQPQPIDLIQLITSVLDSLHPIAESKSIQFETEFDATAANTAGDSGRLRQILRNLLSNAIKFSPEDGKIRVRLTKQQDDEKSFAQIQVIDHGIGIEPDFLPYVFDRFRQADSSTTRSYSGLGLGLAIVRHLTELHDGTVQAESAGEGKGATFTVNLPLLEQPT
ncbi:response regulator [Oculatella sp. FACHB-28]|uniref:hybrid sensor histidine kinase/response regulator n=1 Tax=Oculatella sp. FACHB-28 TaxID=2692845 RepID=UPI0016861153|nr:ATP-binding protein [Oculatella sp. FACHB-28]MBD2059317.1 response regulator [Oculatella sp. FACHB-28]